MNIVINESSARTGWRMLTKYQGRRDDYAYDDFGLFEVIDAPEFLPTGGMQSEVSRADGEFPIVYLSGEAMRPGWVA